MTEQPGEQDPISELLARLTSGDLTPEERDQLQSMGLDLGSIDPAMIRQAMAQVQQMMATGGDGPLNWTLAGDTARQVTAASGDASVGDSARRASLDALRVAALWLDPVTTVPGVGADEHAWSRAEWVEATLPTWRRLAEPVAESVSTALAAAMAEQAPEEMREMLDQAGSMMRRLAGTVFGLQVGQAVGALAGEVVSAFDIGLPLSGPGTTALLPTNVAAFGEGLGVPADEVRLYLALRENAHARLFAHAGWLRSHLLTSVEEFARGITIDSAAIEEAVRNVDATDPAALQQALTGGVFEPQRTPAQQATLTRLETTLALVEGWVDEVTDAAAREQLPEAARLREAVRRRRATGGPAEHTLATLVGLELRPRRLRDAAALWGAMAAQHGTAARDEVWQHPDLMPTTADLDDPLGYAASWAERSRTDSDVDDALRELLDGE